MAASASDESALWARACAGDERAFTAIFDAHVDRVFRHCLRLVPSAADADEVAVAAFFELWRRRAVVRVVSGSVLPWLLVTASNLARNTSRGTRRYKAVLDRLPRESPPDAAEETGEAIDREQRKQALRRALARMSPTDAALLVLTALEEVPVPDAAALLDLSIPAARKRVSRARHRLRDALIGDPVLTSGPTGAQS